MLTDFDQITLERILSPEELQRFIYRLIEDLNFRIRSVENEAAGIDMTEILKKIPEAVKGDDGVTLYTWFKYSANADGSDMTNLPDENTRYIGISYNNLSPTESDDPTDYIWAEYKGEAGAQGVGVFSIQNEYYSSTSAEEPTEGAWSSAMPPYEDDRFLWIRMAVEYDDGTVKYTDPVHDAELDEAFQKLTTAEGNIEEFETQVRGINVRIDGHDRSFETVNGRIDATNLALTDQAAHVTEVTNSLREEIKNASTVTIGGVTMPVDDYLHDIEEFIAANQSVARSIEKTTAGLTDLLERFENYTNNEEKYMKFSEEDGLVIGAEDSNFKTVIDNQRLAFYDNGQEAAYISGQIFYINNAFIKGTLRKASDPDKPGYEEQIQTDGSIRIVWVGV